MFLVTFPGECIATTKLEIVVVSSAKKQHRPNIVVTHTIKYLFFTEAIKLPNYKQAIQHLVLKHAEFINRFLRT